MENISLAKYNAQGDMIKHGSKPEMQTWPYWRDINYDGHVDVAHSEKVLSSMTVGVNNRKSKLKDKV